MAKKVVSEGFLAGSDNPKSGVMCDESIRALAVAVRCAESENWEGMMYAQHMAIGHQIMCRYAGCGRTDFQNAIAQVMIASSLMGAPFPPQQGNYVHAGRAGGPLDSELMNDTLQLYHDAFGLVEYQEVEVAVVRSSGDEDKFEVGLSVGMSRTYIPAEMALRMASDLRKSAVVALDAQDDLADGATLEALREKYGHNHNVVDRGQANVINLVEGEELTSEQAQQIRDAVGASRNSIVIGPFPVSGDKPTSKNIN